MKRCLQIGLLIGVLLGVALHSDSSFALQGGEPTFAYRIPDGVVFDPLPIDAQRYAQLITPTTAPVVETGTNVQPATVITLGTYAGEALMWVASVFGTVIGTAITALIYRLFKQAGIQITETMRARLQEMIVNGLNQGAKEAADKLQGKGQVEIKNAIVANAVTYVQAHGADTLKELGIDPASNAAVEAIKARIETAIADPASPTPAVLDPPQPAIKQAA